MSKIGLIFPGQGSQFVGMGQELLTTSGSAKSIYKQADDILGFSISKVILAGPNDELKRTDIAQPAIFTASVAAWVTLLEKWDLSREECICAGHSLGEYSALLAAQALKFEAGLRLVRRRGQLMQTAGTENSGSMAAVIGLAGDEVEKLCLEASNSNDLQVANLNCPGQVVISGSLPALDRFYDLAREKKIRVMPLPVSGAFHSRFMQTAAQQLSADLAATDFQTSVFQVIANVSGKPVTEPDQFRQGLAKQVTGSVFWESSMRYMVSQGVEFLIEIGPGKVLQGLMRKIAPQIKVLSAFSPVEIEKVVSELQTVKTV